MKRLLRPALYSVIAAALFFVGFASDRFVMNNRIDTIENRLRAVQQRSNVLLECHTQLAWRRGGAASIEENVDAECERISELAFKAAFERKYGQ